MTLEFFWIIAYFLLTPSLTNGAALDLPLPSSLLQTLNSSAPDLSTALNVSSPNTCTKQPKWSFPQFDQEDCKSALLYMYLEEMDVGGTKRLEFLDRTAQAKTHLQHQLTPRKYTFRKSRCPNEHLIFPMLTFNSVI